ncbi:phosphopentomutase [Thalassotalea mangrovi]|uniref:Phosphopentomutase n=1 Tax=Thalassotalea mangrovi TaxID=2572245 RepID=A0A4U1B210_9GAMM|nr:phosphopentomutase [Thalassotalea mangrovi]TKB43333.1 phosphopentomutase [Thalassotalea mangrovi]
MPRAMIMVIDGFGIGAAPDAEAFGDVGANTFANLAQRFLQQEGRTLALPNLGKLGLFEAAWAASGAELPIKPQIASSGAYAHAAEISSGKDTPSGHWEMMGVPVLFDWGYFSDKQNSFSAELLEQIAIRTGIKGGLGNCHASGTTIIAELGEQHMQSGIPILYTSADSVFQVAAHEKTFGLENLYHYCEQVRELLNDMDLNIGRVIARPFVGDNASNFQRTGNRRDYSILPPSPTVLDTLHDNGGTVVSVGKIADIFAHQGISHKVKATGLDQLVDASLVEFDKATDNTLIFTNLVNFDQDYGHRRDPIGYGQALEYFDSRLPEIFSRLNADDYLFLIADHGCDPTWHGSDHTREFVPLIAWSPGMKSIDLGQRDTFADLGATIADIFALQSPEYGTSFKSLLMA